MINQSTWYTQNFLNDPQLRQIMESFELFTRPGDVHEERGIAVSTPGYRRPHIEYGFFDNLGAMAKSALSLSQNAEGTYWTPNPVNPDLAARSYNRVQPFNPKRPATSDADIIERRWLLVDLDPQRPAGISSTDDEHEASLALARSIAVALSEIGWPDPITASSGNGAHMNYRIDLPADDNGLVAGVLQAMDFRFSTNSVKVDTSVFNPGRIWKVYGTAARKGDNIPQRPHRIAQVLSCPSSLVVVSKQQLESFASAYAPQASTNSGLILPTGSPALASEASPRTSASQGRRDSSFNLKNWIERHGLDVEAPRQWKDGHRWVFNVCPWDSTHTDRSAYLIQFGNGAIAAGCHHNGCADQNWQSLRTLFEPEHSAADPIVMLPDGLPPAVKRAFGRANRGGK